MGAGPRFGAVCSGTGDNSIVSGLGRSAPRSQCHGGLVVMTNSAAPVDPNWLLSTTAVSSAALVAIIGGLLVSRVIAIASERDSLRRRARELVDLRMSLLAQADALRRRRLGNAHWKFVTYHMESVLFIGITDPAELLDHFFPPGGEAEDFSETAPGLVATMLRAREEIDALQSDEPEPVTIEGLQSAGLMIPVDAAWIYREVAEKLAEVERSKSSTYGLVRPVIPPPGRTFEDGQVERQRDEDQLRARAEGLKVEQNAVAQEAKRLEATPRGVVPGIGVLALYGVIGILFPLYEMTQRPIEAGPGARMLVFVAFLVGFIVLMGYLFWAVRSIPREVERPDVGERTEKSIRDPRKGYDVA